MEHSVKVIDRKNLEHGQFAVLLQCCDDANHTSWHTFSITHATDVEIDLTAELEKAKLRISKEHEVLLKAAKFFDDLKDKPAQPKT